mgnify:CR=1 FL=1
MAISKAFAFNEGANIDGTDQYGYKDSEIDSQKLEADEVFTDDAQAIAPQPWLLYTITLKK